LAQVGNKRDMDVTTWAGGDNKSKNEKNTWSIQLL
jgi:hypothetical protein